MNLKDFEEFLQKIVADCTALKDKYVAEKSLIVGWICVFSQSDEEYKSLISLSSKIGKIIEETDSGPIYKLDIPLKTAAGIPKLLKIRKPDISKTERGDVDFNTDYPKFKSKYLDNKRFTLIKREKFEMIELKDKDFDVLVYFSSISPSKLRGIG